MENSPLHVTREILRDRSAEGRELVTQFQDCGSLGEKVKLLHERFYKYSDVTVDNDVSTLRKDAGKSARLREEGNAFYKKKQFSAALKCYNQSLGFAPPPLEGDTSNTLAPPLEGDTSNTLAPPLEGDTRNTLALGFANRSAVFCQMKKHSACLHDVDLALQSGYPREERYKLLERRGKCLLAMQRFTDAEGAFQDALTAVTESRLEKRAQDLRCKKIERELALSCDNNNEDGMDQKTPSAILSGDADPYNVTQNKLKETFTRNGFKHNQINSVHIEVSETSGRHFVASRDIAVGENILFEKSAVNVLSEKYYESFCYNCLGLLEHPLPCRGCCRIFFCTSECRESAEKSFHHRECSVLEKFDRFTASGGEQLPTRVALRCLLTLRPCDLDKLDNLDNSGLKADNMRDVSLFSLLSHFEESDLERQLLFTLTGLHGAMALRGSGFWRDILGQREGEREGQREGQREGPGKDKEKEHKRTDLGGDLIVKKEGNDLEMRNYLENDNGNNFENDLDLKVATLLAHFLGAAACNSFQVSSYELPDNHDFRRARLLSVSTCICPLLAMCNHSCTSSADVQFYRACAVLRAVRNIRAGEEVSIDYGPHYTEGEREGRRRELRRKFFFSCQCQACVCNWGAVEEQEHVLPRFCCEECGAEITQPPGRGEKGREGTGGQGRAGITQPPGRGEKGREGTGEILTCPRCRHEQSMIVICEKLGESHRAYNEVMSRLGQVGGQMCKEGEAGDTCKVWSGGDVSEMVGVLERHLTLLDRWVCLPWQDYARCQATLRQLYRCLGNHFYTTDKMW